MPAGVLITPIETPRLLIRPLATADAPYYVRLLDDWEIARWTRNILVSIARRTRLAAL